MRLKNFFVVFGLLVLAISLTSFKWGKLNSETGLEEIKNGFYIETDDQGRLISEGNYKNGLKEARWCYYFLIDSLFDDQTEQLAYARKFLLRKEGKYKTGSQTHYWKCYFDKGNLEAEGWFLKGAKDKFWKYYNFEGQVLSEGHYSQDKKDGWWREYSPKKEIMQKGQYTKGKKVGFWQTFQHGELIAVSKYIDGQCKHTWTSYEDYLNWKKD